jgi:hypothetical protein
MTTTHTPGPWHASKLEDRSAFNIFMPGYCSAGASVHHCSNATDCMGSLVVEANARLIAAAPDLLAALQAVADYWAGGDVPPEIDALMRAAIARATNA